MDRDAIRAASRLLFEELAYKPGDEFPMRSSRPLHPDYTMVVTPEGWVVHQHEGCEDERFRGVGLCRHSKQGEKFVTRDLVTYNPQHQVSTRLEFTSDELQTIKNTICRGVNDTEAALFIETCKSTGLNPFLHQIWAIPRNVKVGDRWEKQMTIQVGVDGYRVIRDRLVDAHGNALFDGMEGPQWSDDNGRSWSDYWDSPKPPKLARVAIYRKGISRPFVAQARWDAYVQKERDGTVTAMWRTMGPEQLAKCAEVLALRRAFPADMNALPSGNIADMEPPPVVSWPTPAQEIAAVHACKVCGSVLHNADFHVQAADVVAYGSGPADPDMLEDMDAEYVGEPEAFDPDPPVVDEPQGDAPDIEFLRSQIKTAFADLKQTKGTSYGAIYNEAHKQWPGLHNGDAKAMAPEEAAVLLAELQEALGA